MSEKPKPFQFRVPVAQKAALMREIAETIAPLYFIAWEQQEGDNVTITIVPASSEKRTQARLEELQSKVDVGKYASGKADPDMEL